MKCVSPLSGLTLVCVAFVALGASAAEICINGVCINSADKSRAGAPTLHADPGVRIERAREGEILYRPGLVLQRGDVIRTADGFAVIDFDDDNIVVVRDRSAIELGSIRLFFGEVFASINRLAKRGGGEVTTDELSASVDGTQYSVRRTVYPGFAQQGDTSVVVRTGRVFCEDPEGRWQPVALTRDSMLRVNANHVPEEVRRVDAYAHTAWADEAVRRLLPERGTRSQPNVNFTLPLDVFNHHPDRDHSSDRPQRGPIDPGPYDGPRGYPPPRHDNAGSDSRPGSYDPKRDGNSSSTVPRGSPALPKREGTGQDARPGSQDGRAKNEPPVAPPRGTSMPSGDVIKREPSRTGDMLGRERVGPSVDVLKRDAARPVRKDPIEAAPPRDPSPVR